MNRVAGFRRNAHFLLAIAALALANPRPGQNLVGTGLVLMGIAIRVWAAGFLEKGGGLCTDGPYGWVRHPLYLGSVVGAVGFCVMMNSWWGWLAVLPLFLTIYAAQAIAEERRLRETYGEQHAEWSRAVPMWLPRRAPATSGTGRRWNWSRLVANREHYHALVTLALVTMFWLRPYWPRWGR